MMIPNQQLRAWLTDPRAIDRTTAAMEEAARAHAETPAISRLAAALDEARDLGADAVIRLARDFLADDEAMRDCLEPAVAAALADPFFRPPLKALGSKVHEGLLLFNRRALSIQLAVMSAEALAAKRAFPRGATSIIFTGQRSVYRFLDAGRAIISIWEAPQVAADFTAGAAGPCRLVERRPLVDGEILEMDGRRLSFVIDHAPGDIAFVQAFTPLGAGSLGVEYDSRTLKVVGASSTDDASSRTRMMLSLLRIMDRRDALPVFREAVGSEHFYARWEAMMELIALDAEAALPDLRRMAAGDPHPEVRGAASETLALLLGANAAEVAPCLS